MIRNWMKNEPKYLKLVDSRKRKWRGGAGSSELFPEVTKCVMEWFRKQRQNKVTVNYEEFRRKSKRVAADLGVPEHDFKGSNKWIRGVMRRNRITVRAVTHTAQQDKSTVAEKSAVISKYFHAVHQKTAGLREPFIFNMDKTPCYYDMKSNRTMHFKGEKQVDGSDSGHSKNRFTTVLCVSLSGTVIKTLIILKGLKKVPNVALPPKIDIAVSIGGSMNVKIMLQWIEKCFKSRGNYFANAKSVLFMDSYGSHKIPEVLDALKSKCNTEVVLIPPKTTSILQPLDVSLNSPFKNALRAAWNDWFTNGPQEFTPRGYRRKPSYQYIVDFVSIAVEKLEKEKIRKAFECCGIAEMGAEVPKEKLNGNLVRLLDAAEADAKTRSLSHRVVFHGLEEEMEEEESEDEEVEVVECSNEEVERVSDDMSESDTD